MPHRQSHLPLQLLDLRLICMKGEARVRVTQTSALVAIRHPFPCTPLTREILHVSASSAHLALETFRLRPPAPESPPPSQTA